MLLAAGAGSADLRVLEITEQNAAQLQIGGPDAIGGIGDYYLANDVVELIVDHPDRRHALLNHGGTIVDLGLRDRRGEDQFARLVPLVNLSQRVVVGYDAIRAERLDAAARVVVTSPGMSSIPRGGFWSRMLDPFVPDPEELRAVRVETVYEVRPGESFVRITTRLENTGDAAAPVFAFGDLWMRAGRSLRAFLGNVHDASLARGFHHVSFSPSNLLGSFDALAPFTHAVAAGLHAYPPIAYALLSPERSAAGLSFFGVTGEHVTFANAFRADPGWRELGLWRLLRTLSGGLAPGETWRIERRLLVTGRADVGSVTDRVVAPALLAPSGLTGRCEPEDVRAVVHVDTAEGHPLTQLAVLDGRYVASLPPGDYRLTLRAEHRADVVREVSVAAGATTEVPAVRFSDVGTLRFDPAFADGEPGRVVIRGLDGTPDPVFGAELLDFRLDGARLDTATETNALGFVGNGHDPREVELPLGRYAQVATRGLEYDIAVREVELSSADEPVDVPPFRLARVASLPDHVSADFHVHSQASDDSGTTNRARLRDFASIGVQVLVATDHDKVPDYDRALREEGLDGRIRVVRGVEITSSTPSPEAPWTIGHHNAWPVARRPLAHRGGAPPSQRMRLAELYSLLRREYAVGVVQLNHPRPKREGLDEGNLFTHQGSAGEPVDVSLPVTADVHTALLEPAPDGTRALDFDVMEVLNGDSRSQYLVTRDDFHWLLRQGFRHAATANSDTHGPQELAGLPRNYVRVGDAADPGALDRALRAGRSFGTNGPLITRFSVNGGGSGDTVGAEGGRVRIAYEVVGAAWVPIDEVRVLVDGRVVHATAERAGSFELDVGSDAFVTLEAGAPLDADPLAWRRDNPGPYTDTVAPGHVSTAFTNPVYVDADGDGAWTPPGLPDG